MIKNLFATKHLFTGLLAAALVFIPGAVFASFGPERPTIQYNGVGTPGADHVVFNSFTNVPNVGDERQFFHGQVVGTGSYSDPVQANIGDEVLVRVYVHNNADPSLNESGEGIAQNTRVRVELPSSTSNDQQATAFVSADNAQPQEIFDTINIVSDQAYRLDYIEGSANIRTNFIDQPLSDELVTNGVQIGHEALNGTVNGCFEYAAYVTFKVKLNAQPELSIDKTVRRDGGSSDDWTDNLTNVQIGDIVEYKLTVLNTGTTDVGDVIVTDNLPNHLDYLEGSDKVINNVIPEGESLGDTVTNGGVLLKDTYTPGSGAHVLFKAQVTDMPDTCDEEVTLTNVGQARTGSTETIEDTATIAVYSGDCETVQEVVAPVVVEPETEETEEVLAVVAPVEEVTELPNTGAGTALATLLGTGSSFGAARMWLHSRKALKNELLEQ